MYNDILIRSFEILNIAVSNKQLEQFDKYYEILIDWNNKINLTAITGYEDVILKHFIDSILLMKFIDINDKRIIDIGTGAGFPGIPLKIMNPDCDVVLMDSLNKRINFLNEAISVLNLNNICAVHGRAEDAAHDKKYRNNFDLCVSRAVANLRTLSEYCIPFVKKGGLFVSYKSDKCEDEINDSKNAINVLRSKIKMVNEIVIPQTDIVRRFIIIENINRIDNKYPRKAGTPSKDPL